MEKPAVSIIVAVYNTQKYLRRCLNSLVFQTFQNIEVIVVNDGSTDDSQKIIDSYVEKFPQIMVAVKKENGGLSLARKAGIEKAKGEWVMFVDSDDWVHPCAIELMLRKQAENDGQMVYAPYANVYDTSRGIVAGSSVQASSEDGCVTVGDILRQGNNSFWGKLWNREFMLQNAHFYHIWHEDVAEIPALISKLERVSYVKTPLYFYYQDNSDSITKTSDYNEKRLDLFKVDEWCYQDLNPEYEYEYKIKLANRLASNTNFKEVYDKSVIYAKEAWEKYQLDEVMDELSTEQQKKLQKILALEQVVMPEIVYVNDFDGQMAEHYGEDVKRAFFKVKEIVPLNMESCKEDFDEFAERLLQDERYRELGIYFACRKIWKTGGIYLSPEIEITDALDMLKFNPATFCMESREHISQDFFGGAAGNKVFQEILDYWITLEERNAAGAVQKAVDTILIGFSGIHMRQAEQTGIHGEKVYSAEWLWFHFAVQGGCLKRRGTDEYTVSMENFIWHEKKIKRIENEYRQTVQEKKQLIQQIRDLKAEKKQLRQDARSLKAERKQLKQENRDLKAERKQLKDKIRYMQQSISWKITKPFRFLLRILKRK